jgi:hypothetical protein
MSGITQAGKFLQEQIRMVDPKVIQTEYPEYWGAEGEHHTVKEGLPFGVKEVSTVRLDYSGRAVNWTGKTRDIPLANYAIDTDNYKTLACALGAEWGFEELLIQEAAEKSGVYTGTVVDVVTAYNNALQKGIQEWMHIRTLFGDPEINFYGLFTNPDVEQIIVSDDLYALTPSELQDYFHGIVNDFTDDIGLTATEFDVLTNVKLFAGLTKQMSPGNASSTTPYELLTDPDKGAAIKSISKVNELKNKYLLEFGKLSAGDDYDMFMVYDSSEDTLDKMMSNQILTNPRLTDSDTYRRMGYQKISEVRFKKPFKARYFLYPKAS